MEADICNCVMTELGEEIREAVLSVLPYLPEQTLSSLQDKLASVGIEGKPDLQFLKEEALQDHIRPIQCQKLLNAWRFEGQARCDTAGAIEDASTFEPSSPSPSQSSSTSSTTRSTTSTTSTVDLDIWPENFTVCWCKMSMNLRSAIARGTQPTSGEQREMRCAINASPAPKIAELRSKWSYLFTQKELYNHFKLLIHVSILGKKTDATMVEKRKIIIQYFLYNPTNEEVRHILSMFEKGGATAVGPYVVLLLMAHFQERTDAFLLQADVSDTATDVEGSIPLPDSPRLILQGDTMTAAKWMMSIEKEVVMPVHSNFVAALAAFFLPHSTPSIFSTKRRLHAPWSSSKDVLLESVHPLPRRPPQQRTSARKAER
eukprot:XP_014012007.1 PREDICTED: uncharacterized protein LOC106578010 isoform X2 [Salmo salar]